ncbi:MAG: ImmA/IrrE family metallo-endopeptidase [Gemmatimonadaceae bacterium]|nr:ImmA/IrrE family metallo-endopeptidase [Gemmatimonadaceae bacterium]MBA3557210.1 ImmA/IrrE family metallo-endopeptidase [Gemmatimonadaceae bacterium]
MTMTEHHQLPEFVPLVLTIARESRRMSQSALAKAAGLSQGALSQIEAGRFVPTDEVVQRLATELRYPPSLFGVSLRFQQLPLTFFRKKARVGVRDVNAIRARINLYRLRLEIMLRAVELPDVRVSLTDMQKQKLTPEEAAQRLRRYWNVPPGPIQNVTALVEEHGILVVPVDFGTAAVDGLSIYEPNDNMPPMIFINPDLPPDRWRMTVVHELGHIVCHHHLLIPPDGKDMETEAFQFAQEFLMPTREISGQLTRVSMREIAALKLYWRVSMRALVKRARALGRISDRQERWLFIQLARDGQSEIVGIAAEHAKVVRGMVDRHADLGFSHQDLSRTLHQEIDEFRSDFGVGVKHLRLA